MNSKERYITNQARIKARKIYSFLQAHKKEFIRVLNKQEEKSFFKFERKGFDSDLNSFIEDIKKGIPEYLALILPSIMIAGASEDKKKFKKELPKSWSLGFDLDISPASAYVRDTVKLHLSDKAGSILNTTKDELKKIVADGIDKGSSWGTIAKEINTIDPFVFSKTRAKLIATNEVGRAYGWASHEPGRELQKEGYILDKSWQTSHDGKVRPKHYQNEHDGWIPFDQPFSGTGDDYAPSTVDFNCRCTSTRKIVGVKK